MRHFQRTCGIVRMCQVPSLEYHAFFLHQTKYHFNFLIKDLENECDTLKILAILMV